MDLFISLDAWLSALIFSLLMLLSWWLGDRQRLRAVGALTAAPPQKTSTRIEDATLGLFGLLLAFCFSGASSRFEARKEVLLNDAMAVSSLMTVSSLLEEPERGALHAELAHYVDQRLIFGVTPLTDPSMEGLLLEARASQERMRTLVSAAVVSKNTPTVHPSLVNAFGDVTESADRRLNRLREHVPGTIVIMLVLFGVFAAFTMGRLRDAQPCEAGGRSRIVAYAALVGLVFYVTIDLEQPRRGLLRISQAPMEEVKASLATPGTVRAPQQP